MKKLFQAIRKGDLELVKKLIEKDPALVNCVAKQPPKKDDGQSPLQVALKSGNFPIAEFLLRQGANVNFMESEDCCNHWRAPVIHDAITAAVMCSRWNVLYEDGLEVFSTEEEANAAYALLEQIVELGADVNALDSVGNSCLWRFCLQARQILPTPGADDRVLTPELQKDLSRISHLLYSHGMDMDYVQPYSQDTALKTYSQEPLAQFLIFT